MMKDINIKTVFTIMLCSCLFFSACGNPEDGRETFTVTFVATWYGKVGTGQWGNWEDWAEWDNVGDVEFWYMDGAEGAPGIGKDDDGNDIGEVDILRTIEYKRLEQTNTTGRVSNIPSPPDRDDYEFLGWYSSGGTPVSIRTLFSSDTSVFAKWNGGENVANVEDGPVAREFTRIRNTVLAGGQPSFTFTINVTQDETILPQLLDYNGRRVYIILNGIIPSSGISPVITLSGRSGMGSLFSIGTNVTLELRNMWLQGGSRNSTSLLSVNSGGRLIIGQNNADTTLIFNNTAEDPEEGGGAVAVNEGGELIMNGGEISENFSLTGQIGLRGIGGGGVLVRGGTFTMYGGKIHRNGSQDGGGVLVYRFGKFTMNGGEIFNNDAISGGGVQVARGLFEMNGGKIYGNIANDGGGVFVNRGMSNVESANPYDPRKPSSSTNDPAKKEGFYFHGGEIYNNGVGNAGAGIYNSWGSFTFMDGGTVYGNTAWAVSGVHNYGFFIMVDGVIRDNKGTYGGGVDAAEGIFIMENGRIINNESTNSGGGVTVGEFFIMHGGEISGNMAGEYGGGISIQPSGSFAMSGGTIAGNTALRPDSGTIYFLQMDTLDLSAVGVAYYGIRTPESDSIVVAWGKDIVKDDGNGPYDSFEITSYLEQYGDNIKIEVKDDGDLYIDEEFVPRTE
jgi:hypothetical protein